MLRLGVHLVAAGNGANFDATFFRSVAGNEFVERSLHDHFFFAKRGGELFDRGGLISCVDDGFESGSAFFVDHEDSLPSAVYS